MIAIVIMMIDFVYDNDCYHDYDVESSDFGR